ncbi:efflux RND transporter periplasmic adaptor subunit [Algihabitans albus]|uniref:efflux RND transporter periplasmic adaptor subunit n=1 Tax=Algihabitans albus TaxID=2164067 RepID=UPI000E5D1344|nr:efflux RND transporter periplasmic adaptor subunit [Algihabitans albus]
MTQTNEVQRRSGLVGLVGRLTVAAAIFAVIAGGVATFHLRAAAEDEPEALVPLPVQVQTVLRQDSYRINERFAGRLEPARRSSLAFERAGLLIEVMVEEGDRVETGQLLAQLDIDPLLAQRDAVTAQQAQVAADLDLARRTLRRQRDLFDQGHVSSQRLDEARLSADALAARARALAADLRALDIDIDKSTLRAPFSGQLAARHLDEGAVVSPGGAVLDLLESSRPQARIGVTPEAARRIFAGATFALQASGKDLEGRLAATRPDIAPETRSIELLFDLADRQDVPFGEVVTLRLAREIDGSGFWLPLTALYEDEKGLWSVFTLIERDGDSLVARETVEVLHAEDGQAFVRGTLAAQADVVVGNAERVVPGQRVRPVPPTEVAGVPAS